jgi:hypothetical protein
MASYITRANIDWQVNREKKMRKFIIKIILRIATFAASNLRNLSMFTRTGPKFEPEQFAALRRAW